MSQFSIHQRKVILETRPFKVEEIAVSHQKEATHTYFRLNCVDWVNVLPVTPDQKAVLIRQPRYGSLKHTLEIPGGEVDPGEKNDPTLAAARELEEETGYTSQNLLSLGSFSPNPAFMTNRMHLFLALGCQKAAERRHMPDASEQIEVELIPIQDLEALVRTGAIDHSLCSLCILLALKYLRLDAPTS